MKTNREELRDELLAVTAARSELSRDDEQYLIEHFLDKLDREIDARITARAVKPKPVNTVGVVSVTLVAALPLSFIAVFAGWQGLFVTWIALIAIVYLTTRNR